MKTTFSHIFLTLSILIILDVFNAGQALVVFLLAGVVPGTNLIVSADLAFALILALFGVLCGRTTRALLMNMSGLFVGRRNTLRPQV